MRLVAALAFLRSNLGFCHRDGGTLLSTYALWHPFSRPGGGAAIVRSFTRIGLHVAAHCLLARPGIRRGWPLATSSPLGATSSGRHDGGVPVIAHVSDLHFGAHVEARAETLLVDVWERKPDLVVVSGDLTQRARQAEFSDARRFLDRLPSPVLIVPGNHDLPLINLPKRMIRPHQSYAAVGRSRPRTGRCPPQPHRVRARHHATVALEGGQRVPTPDRAGSARAQKRSRQRVAPSGHPPSRAARGTLQPERPETARCCGRPE